MEELLVHLDVSLLWQVEHLKACDDIAKTRTANWQAFCLEKNSE